MNALQKRLNDLEERHAGDRTELAKMRATARAFAERLDGLETLAREMMTDDGWEHAKGEGITYAVSELRAVLKAR